jgi:hypothetical protein
MGIPAGITAKFNPTKISTGTQSTLTLAVSNTVVTGKYPVTVTATSGKVKKQVVLELNVVMPPSFNLSTSPGSLSVRQGGTSTVTVNLIRTDGFGDVVALTLEGTPAGVKAAFSPALVTAEASTLTLEVANDAMPGTYTVTVRGRGGGLDKTAQLTLTIEGFSLNLTPASVLLKQGTSLPIIVSVTRDGGFIEPVELAIEGIPVGVTAVFGLNPIPADTSATALTVGATCAPGTYTFRVRATGGGISKTVDSTIVVFTRESVEIAFPRKALEILPEWERIEQVRDWIVYAFLAAREVPPDRIAVALHNQPPLRNPALSEVHTWQYGIGRWVWIDDDPKDGSIGDLYAFLPKGEDQRLLGGLADEFRRMTGQIPTFVHHIEYTLDESAGTATFVLSQTLDGKQLFVEEGPFGYYERDIRTRTDLVEFLKRVDGLVYAELRDNVLRLGGRDLLSWRPMVDVEDVAALYQAYLKANDVGFSLDPESADVSEDIVLLTIRLGLPKKEAAFVALFLELPEEVPIPSVSSSEWEEARISLLNKQLLPLHRVMKKLLAEGTADARKVYDEIASLLGRYMSQCARYDGDIKGTKVGMTLFYCDLLMKLWFWDFENSTPRDIGMIPVLEFPISPAHWGGIWEFPEGRRWLGANPSRIGKNPTSLLFSPTITRIFAAVNDPNKPGEEVEPSKLPERMRITNQWWEAHWPEIMNYEPQYFRLNQLMKLSTLMAWLRFDVKRMQALAFLEQEPVVRTHDFEQWLNANRGRLTFKAWLPFVGHSDKGTECLSLICSETRPAFGSQAAFLSGGITLTGKKELARSLDTVDFIKRVGEITRLGRGKVIGPGTEATYTWNTPFAVAITPGADASFRTPALVLPRIQKIEDSWQRMESAYKYSSIWRLETSQLLDTHVSLERAVEGPIRIEATGSALVAERLAQALSGRLKIPEYVQEIYYKPTTRNLFIKTIHGWFQAVAKSLPENILQGGSPVTSYISAVQYLADPPSVEEKWAVNLEDIKDRVSAWEKGKAGSLVFSVGEFYYVATKAGPTAYYTFSADSKLAQALTKKDVLWPTSPQDVEWWWGFEQFVGHLFSKLPKPIKWDIQGTKVILYTPDGTQPVMDVPMEIENNMDKWLKVKPIETGLEIESLEKRHA